MEGETEWYLIWVSSFKRNGAASAGLKRYLVPGVKIQLFKLVFYMKSVVWLNSKVTRDKRAIHAVRQQYSHMFRGLAPISVSYPSDKFGEKTTTTAAPFIISPFYESGEKVADSFY